MDKVTLSSQLINNLVAYLATRPFQEVAGLIGAIEKEAQAQQTAEAPNGN
jgi:hypothetical protein